MSLRTRVFCSCSLPVTGSIAIYDVRLSTQELHVSYVCNQAPTVSLMKQPFSSAIYSHAELLKEFEFLATKQLDKDSDEISAIVSHWGCWGVRTVGVVVRWAAVRCG